MAPNGYTVAGSELVDLATRVNQATARFDELAKQVLPHSAVPEGNWPLSAAQAQQVYTEARQSLASSSQAMVETSAAVTDGITRVLRNYGLAEQASKIPPPRPRDLSVAAPNGGSSWQDALATIGFGVGAGVNSVWSGWQLWKRDFGRGLTPYLKETRSLKEMREALATTSKEKDFWLTRDLQKALHESRTFIEQEEHFKRVQKARLLLRSRASATGFSLVVSGIVFAADAHYVSPNLRPASPFLTVSRAWDDIAYDLNTVAEGDGDKKGLKDLALNHWTGEAKEGFVNYMKRSFLPVIRELSSLCEAMGQLCDSIAYWMQIFLTSMMEAMVLTTLALMIAGSWAALTPYGEFFSAACALAYLGFAARIAAQFQYGFGEIARQVKKINGLADDLALRTRGDTKRLNSNTNKLRLTLLNTVESGNWLDGFRPKSA